MVIIDKKIRQKKFNHFVLSLFCFFSLNILLSGTSTAAPVGNPAGPVLLEGNYPTKVTLEAEVVKRKLKSGSSGSPKYYGSFYMGKVSFFTGNKLDVYGMVGASEAKLRNFISEAYLIDSKTDIAYGAGATYVIHEYEFMNGLLRLGADAKWRQFKPDIDNLKIYRELTPSTDNGMSFTEWQIALGLAYQYKKYVPYFGLKYSDMRGRVKFTQGGSSIADNNLESSHIFGLFYGMDILLSDNMSFNIEGRNIDEDGLSTSFNFRF